MNDTVVKYGGGALVAVAMIAGGNHMASQEEKALIEQYGLSDSQVMVMKFCVNDLNRTDLTYDRSTSDRKICGCIADKVAISAQFSPVLEGGISRYTTFTGNTATTGLELAEQMTDSVGEGVIAATMRHDINQFGQDYKIGESLCLMSLD